ncbi:RIP metalloprotease RseP [bacterium]|nr:RIP metalloprotease RseP [bacterium]
MTLLWFIIVIGIIVFVHEFGHFIVAKMCGVYVDTFSLGFGPRIFWYTIGETEYRISAIPLGGYVRMAGQVDVPEEYDKELAERYKDVPTYRRYDKQSVPKRMAIIVAGPFMNLLFALPVAFMLLFIGANEPLDIDATTIGNIIPDSPAQISGLIPGDKVLAIAGYEVKTWRDFINQTRKRIGTKTSITYERNGREIIAEINPELDEEKGFMGIGVSRMARAQIISITSNSPAYKSKFQLGDVVDRIIGIRTTELSMEQLIKEVRKHPNQKLLLGVKRFPPFRYASQSNTFTSTNIFVMTKRAGKIEHISILPYSEMIICEDSAPTNFQAKTGDEILLINGRKVDTEKISEYIANLPKGKAILTVERITGRITKSKISTNINVNIVDVGQLGVVFAPAHQRILYHTANAINEAPKRAMEKVDETIQVLSMLFQRKLGLNSLAGPVGIARITGAAARSGFDVLLNIILLITVNLGILNLLPLPVLDGGHLVLLAAEGIYRKPLSIKFVLWYQKIGFFLLISLMAYVLYNDIVRWIIDSDKIGLILGKLAQLIGM